MKYFSIMFQAGNLGIADFSLESSIHYIVPVPK